MDAIDFLRKDYELKANYLTAHFSRMWTRFNFFLTIESALLAFSFNKDSAQYTGYLAIAGLLLSILWYRFAATDNFLVEVYRSQVAHVFDLLRTSREAAFEAAGLEPRPEGYSYVGSVSDKGFNPITGQVEPIEQNVWQKRSRRVSVTELGVVFALLFSFLWIGRLILWFVEWYA
jgi:hypothetical protein